MRSGRPRQVVGTDETLFHPASRPHSELAWKSVTTKRRQPSTRERILEAAFDVIAEAGLDGFTMTEVERRVGLAVGTGSIYRHFPSKGALLKAAVEWGLDRNRSLTHEARSALQHVSDPKERRLKVYKRMLQDLGRFDKIFGLVLSQGDRVPDLQEAIRAAVQPRETATAPDEEASHVVAMAALGGYHLFSIMQGRAFHGVAEDDFLQMLVSFTGPRCEETAPSSKKRRIKAP
jgi:AcrR family transcriptional regulator